MKMSEKQLKKLEKYETTYNQVVELLSKELYNFSASSEYSDIKKMLEIYTIYLKKQNIIINVNEIEFLRLNPKESKSKKYNWEL